MSQEDESIGIVEGRNTFTGFVNIIKPKDVEGYDFNHVGAL